MGKRYQKFDIKMFSDVPGEEFILFEQFDYTYTMLSGDIRP
jgi:hypothetical protein